MDVTSAELTVRNDYIQRIKKGEILIAVIAGFASCALVLQAGIDKDPSGKS